MGSILKNTENSEKYRLLKYETDSPHFEKANLSAKRYLRLQASFGGIRT
jgi:hypothetical protein